MRPSPFITLGLGVPVAACAGSAQTAPPAPPPASVVLVAPDAGNPTALVPGPVAPDAPVSAEPTPDAGADVTPSLRAAADVATPAAESAPRSACNEQPPQDFLVRGNFLKGGEEALRRAIQYRTETYGYFKGFGHAAPDAPSPSTFVVSTTFMDLPVRMHRKVVPALRCVEVEIKQSCTDHPYTPQALAGIRFRNTYRGGEVTNHIYGIAIDVDPARNTCCGCVPPWNDAPACKRPSKTEYDRMAMPECWVHAFERYGFYWLGHDRLRDTMHFEFLGDPDRIVRSGSPALGTP
jgi:D-alanyl-D-alanine carboxypeptidase